jgi:tetratricopeptide (TPR) repeat protein/transcriptional regulator with XRE-family HTH domain
MAAGEPLTFGMLLKRYRRAAALTQEALAERAGYSASYVSQLERGERVPARDTILVLATTLALDDAERTALLATGRAQQAAPHGPALREEAPPPLVGRQRELVALEQHLAGSGPPLLFLSGEPGIGKSRLLYEAKARAPRHRLTVLAGGCYQRGGQEPYAPLLGALAARLREQPRAQVRADVHGCAWLVRLLPELAESSLIPWPTWSVPPDQERRLMFVAVQRFLANVAGQGGTLLVLDNLQWAQPDALDLLAALARAPRPPRVVAAYRATEAAPGDPLSVLVVELGREGLASRIEIEPLNPLDTAELVAHLIPIVGKDAAESTRRQALRDQLARRADGLPFFLVSCARGLAGGAMDEGEQSLPWTLRESIRQRIAALPETTQQCLGASAVAGRISSLELLLAVTGQPEREALAALKAACQARLLVEYEDDSAMVSYAFAHDLLREVVVSEMSAGERNAWHRRIAETLEQQAGGSPPALLAYHYTHSGMHERALPYLAGAVDRALGMHAFAEAERFAAEWVATADQLGRSLEAARAREQLAEALHRVARYDEARGALESAAGSYRRSGDAEGYARAEARISWMHGRRGAAEEGLIRLRAALETLATMAPSPLMSARLYAMLAVLHGNCGHDAEELAFAEQAIALAQAAGDDRAWAQAAVWQGRALKHLGQTSQALAALQTAVELTETVGDLEHLTRALMLLADVHVFSGAWQDARACLERARAHADLLGEGPLIAYTLCEQGDACYFMGDWRQARACYVEANESIQSGSIAQTAWMAPFGAGRFALFEGRKEEALALLRQAHDLAVRFHRYEAFPDVQSALAERDLLLGHPAVARRRLAPFREPFLADVLVDAGLPLLAWAQLDLGADHDAEALVTQALARATAQEHRLVLVDALRVQALLLLRRARWREAEATLEQSLELCRVMPYPYAAAKALFVWGQMETARGNSEQARERYLAALAQLDDLGERLYAAHIEQALGRIE